MSSLFKQKVLFEFSAFAASLGAILIAFYAFVSIYPPKTEETKEKIIATTLVTDNQGLVPNFKAGNQAEISLMSSLRRENQLTLFGSSEFSENKYATYNYFPTELNIPTQGFGHAFHQCLHIFSELLVARESLKDSKVVIFLSPGWFETEGNNTEAFLEFVTPNFLEKIWNDDKINEESKIAIGRFIFQNANSFDGLTKRMNDFKNLYESEETWAITPKLKILAVSIFPQLNEKTNFLYLSKENKLEGENKKVDFEKIQLQLQSEFLKTCTNNKIFVDDVYFSHNLIKGNGEIKKGKIDQIDLKANNEYYYFKLLIELLKKEKANCSFVIQGLNPFYYQNINEMDALINTLVADLDRANFPYLNLYTSNKEDYVPGTLSDVMHLGKYGWMKVNEFIFKTYAK